MPPSIPSDIKQDSNEQLKTSGYQFSAAKESIHVAAWENDVWGMCHYSDLGSAFGTGLKQIPLLHNQNKSNGKNVVT